MQALKLTKKYEKYPEYKNSGVEWLGKIPKEWRVGKVKEVFSLLKERSFNNSEAEVLSLTLNGIKTRDISNNEGQIAASYEGYRKIIKGDIVLNPMDLVRGFVDSSKHEGIISPAYSTLRKKKKETNSQFYNYFFQKHYFEGIFHPYGNGVSVDHRWTLKDDTLLNFPIVECSEDEQIRIAKFLDEKASSIDKVIEKRKKLVQLLKEEIYSYALEFSLKNNTTKGLWEVGNNRYKFEKAKWIFEEINIRNWVEEEQLAVTQDYGVIPRRFCKEDYTSAASNENLKLVENNDFVISLRSFEGGIEYSDFNGLVSPAYTVIRLKRRYNNDLYKVYYKYLLKSPQFINILNTVVSGIRDGKNINFVDFKNIILPIPPIDSLKKMKLLMEKIKILSSNIKKEENLLMEYKFSLISNVITGKIKV